MYLAIGAGSIPVLFLINDDVAGGLAGGVVVYGVEGVIFRVVCRVVVIAVVRLGGVVVGAAVMVVVGHYLLQGGGS